MIAKGKVTTGVPGYYVRFDDGSSCTFPAIAHCLENGIPVTLDLNFFSLRDGGPANYHLGGGWRLRKSDVRGLIEIAARNRTPFEIANHSNTNWSTHETISTVDEIIAELDPIHLVREFDQPVKVYVQPGDQGPFAWVRARRNLVQSVLEDLGYEFAIGLVQFTGISPLLTGSNPRVPGSALYAPTPGFTNGSIRFTPGDPWNMANGQQGLGGPCGLRPGQVVHPMMIPDVQVSDIGSYFIPRGLADGSPDPHSGERAWLFGRNNNGLGVEGAGAYNDGRWSAQAAIASMLAGGLWSGVAMHGELRSDEVQITKLASGRGSAGTPAALPGHWSTKHLVNFLVRLREKGHIRPQTAQEFYSELWSEFAVGADVVSNPTFSVPIHDVDEDLCPSVPEIVSPRGMSTPMIQASSTYQTNLFLGFAADADQDARVDDPQTARTIVGSGVAGIYGKSGAVILNPGDGATALPGEVFFQHPFMHPGLYRCRLAVSGNALDNISRSGLAVIGHRMRKLVDDGALLGANDWSPEFTVLNGSREYKQITLGGNDIGFIEFLLELPRHAPAMRTLRVSGLTATGLAAGSSVSLGTFTVEGAKIGKRVWVFCEDTSVASNRMVTGVVTGPDRVELTFHNGTAGAINLPGADWYILVEHVAAEETGTPGGHTDWIYTVTYNFAKDGTKEIRLSDFHLELIAQR